MISIFDINYSLKINFLNKYIKAINSTLANTIKRINDIFVKLFKSKKLKLSRLIINTLFKTMAYKDEFEVARLYTDGRFENYLNENFEGELKLDINDLFKINNTWYNKY